MREVPYERFWVRRLLFMGGLPELYTAKYPCHQVANEYHVKKSKEKQNIREL